jgi:hypothetical protein
VATIQDFAEGARQALRDFPRFSQQVLEWTTRTIRLEHPNVVPESLWIAKQATGDPAPVPLVANTGYWLDSRNGVVRFANTYPAGTKILIECWYYEWLLDEDLTFAAQMAWSVHETPTLQLDNVSDAVADTMIYATVVEALYSLAAEYARDIDVHGAESVFIPARQRFPQVMSLLEEWKQRYRERAQLLNIGPERIDQFALRRISYTFGRLVPLYKPKEIGDVSAPVRLFPPIGPGTTDQTEQPEPGEIDVLVEVEPTPGAYVSWPWQ